MSRKISHFEQQNLMTPEERLKFAVLSTKLNLNVILLILQDSILFSWQYTKAILKFLPKEYIFCNTNRIIYIHKENKKKENGNFEESWKNFKKKRKIN